MQRAKNAGAEGEGRGSVAVMAEVARLRARVEMLHKRHKGESMEQVRSPRPTIS